MIDYWFCVDGGIVRQGWSSASRHSVSSPSQSPQFCSVHPSSALNKSYDRLLWPSLTFKPLLSFDKRETGEGEEKGFTLWCSQSLLHQDCYEALFFWWHTRLWPDSRTPRWVCSQFLKLVFHWFVLSGQSKSAVKDLFFFFKLFGQSKCPVNDSLILMIWSEWISS